MDTVLLTKKMKSKRIVRLKDTRFYACLRTRGYHSGAKVDEEALEVDRMGFQDMLEYLVHHEVDYVVTLNTSRLWRSDIVKVLVHRELKKYGVDIRSIEQPQYSIHKKDPSDFLINGLMELLDQYQRLEIALKLGRGRNKKAQQDGYAGGNVALGY